VKEKFMAEKKKLIRDPSQIPSNMSMKQKVEFWKQHEATKDYLEKLGHASEDLLPPPRARSISVRFDEDTLQRLKILAQKKAKPYQTLLKEFVLQRLWQEEERENIVNPPTEDTVFALASALSSSALALEAAKSYEEVNYVFESLSKDTVREWTTTAN
jgi:predicted DNA binding CopG/RHH family protein